MKTINSQISSMNFKNIVYLVGIYSAAAILTSCAGDSSDPLEKYGDIQSVPPSNRVSETQTIVQPDLFAVEIIGDKDVNEGQFTEEKSSQMVFKVIAKSPKILRYTVELVDFTSIERPSLAATDSPEVYALRWTPPRGIIPTGIWGKSFKAQLQVTVVEAKDQQLLGITKTENLNLIVARDSSRPKIAAVQSLKDGLDEGQKKSFYVDVEDFSASAEVRLPEVQITPYIYSNTEAYRADASRFISYDDQKADNPEKISEAVWRFHYVMKADHLPLDRDRKGNEITTSTSLDLCFQVRAIGAAGNLSEQLQVCTKGRYQAPVKTTASGAANEN